MGENQPLQDLSEVVESVFLLQPRLRPFLQSHRILGRYFDDRPTSRYSELLPTVGLSGLSPSVPVATVSRGLPQRPHLDTPKREAHTNTESGTKSRSEQGSIGKTGLARINFAWRRANRSLETEKLASAAPA